MKHVSTIAESIRHMASKKKPQYYQTELQCVSLQSVKFRSQIWTSSGIIFMRIMRFFASVQASLRNTATSNCPRSTRIFGSSFWSKAIKVQMSSRTQSAPIRIPNPRIHSIVHIAENRDISIDCVISEKYYVRLCVLSSILSGDLARRRKIRMNLRDYAWH